MRLLLTLVIIILLLIIILVYSYLYHFFGFVLSVLDYIPRHIALGLYATKHKEHNLEHNHDNRTQFCLYITHTYISTYRQVVILNTPAH